jgi:NAD(P)-dependent dehydrogenase (short-subunit alcohol dehydrogenase family)
MAKKVFITGSNKGIGKQIAREFGRRGWVVLIGTRDEKKGLETVAELREEGIELLYINIDLKKQETILTAANVITSQHADLSLLINNAGVPGNMQKPGYEFTTDELRDTMETNFFGPFELTRLLLPVLEANNGRIVNISIPIGVSGFFNPFAYKTSKAALNVMTQSLAQNFKQADKPLEIFAIMPGATTTDLNGNSTGPYFKTPAEAGKLITGIILDGKNHNGEVINNNGAVADYNYGLNI